MGRQSATVLAALFCIVHWGQGEICEGRQIRQNQLRKGGQAYVPGEIIVKFKNAAGDSEIGRLNVRHGASEIRASRRGRFKRLRIATQQSVEEMIEAYKEDPLVEYAEANYIRNASFLPDDPYYVYQWNFDDAVYGGIGMEEAWDVTTGDPSVIIAVLDTGIAYEDYREEVRFGDRYYQAPDLAQTLFVSGYDFINDDEHPNDDEGHGTHVTGTIAQSTNNGTGVAGIAFGCSIMPVKVLDGSGSGTDAHVAEGIMWAADNGANVINMSLGGSSPSRTLEEACRYAYEKGVTIVCAAGNSGEASIDYPAGYDNYCIAVGAIRYDQTLTYYSSYGPSLDLVAPGGDNDEDQNNDGQPDGIVQQTFSRRFNNWGYYLYEGTSMAAPHVAGVAALLIANGNATTPDEVRLALQETAKDLGEPGLDTEYGWGLIDAAVALYWQTDVGDDISCPVISNPTGDTESTTGEGVAISAMITDDIAVTAASVRYIPIDGTETAVAMQQGADDTWVATLPVALNATGTISYYVTARDRSGKTAREPVDGSYIVTVTDNDAPVADAGPDQVVQTGAVASFDGTDSSDNIGIVSYSWDFDAEDGIQQDSTEESPQHVFEQAGVYTVSLTVNDAEGNGPVTDTLTVEVTDQPPQIEVLQDSFETHGWGWFAWYSFQSTLWMPDRQYAWYMSNLRSTDGRYSAQVSGRARDAVLTSLPIDLQGRENVEITFDWLIEESIDRREYLAFDVKVNGGPWIESRRLDGNRDAEGVWHNEAATLNGVDRLQIRFRAKISSWRESGSLDNVKVVAW